VLGPTAAGKSAVAIEIARRCGGEVVSADSMQVYREMDIGTAKASAEVRAEVPHHLIDVCDPEQEMAVAQFQALGREVLADVDQRKVIPVICGGSGLHFRSLVDPLRFPPSDPEVRSDLDEMAPEETRERLLRMDPTAGSNIDMDNPRRVVRALEIAVLTGKTPTERALSPEAKAVRDYEQQRKFVAIGLDPGPTLPERVEQRFDRMLDSGLLDEVDKLSGRLGRLAAQAVGYKQLLPVVAGEVGIAAGREAAIQATRSLAKRQRTFFRRDPRIVWLPWVPDPGKRAEMAIEELNRRLEWTL
jgi:tRNA dimethylallyltransferase